MKTIYRRPYWIPKSALIVITLIALGALLLVEQSPRKIREPHHDDMLAAARLARQMGARVKTARLARGLEINPRFDPTESGLIGIWMSPVTSVYGNLAAKQSSINPDFAGLVLKLLRQAGVHKGDVVAVGLSGSFPALNIAVEAALATLEVKPVIIAAITGSQWGGNIPDFSWLDMEAVLFKEQLIPFRSIAASIGGKDECPRGVDPGPGRCSGHAQGQER